MKRVPDINKIDESKSDLQDRLASLGEQFNTNKTFGLMGMLEAEQKQISQSQPQLDNIAATTPSKEVEDTSKPPEWLDPLNSSLRAISEQTVREIGSLRNELSSLRQPVQSAAEETEPADPVAQKLSSMETTINQTRLNTAWERARNALNSAKGKYGDEFDFKEKDLQDVWRQHIGTNVQAAEGTNWDIYLQQQYDSRRAPKLESRMKALEAELARQKSGEDPMSKMAAVPRANRNGAPQPSTGVTGDFDEDVYRKASARMGKRIGSFAGFNRLLVEEQNRKLLRTAG
jgi:hypothetical protein